MIIRLGGGVHRTSHGLQCSSCVHDCQAAGDIPTDKANSKILLGSRRVSSAVDVCG